MDEQTLYKAFTAMKAQGMGNQMIAEILKVRPEIGIQIANSNQGGNIRHANINMPSLGGMGNMSMPSLSSTISHAKSMTGRAPRQAAPDTRGTHAATQVPRGGATTYPYPLHEEYGSEGPPLSGAPEAGYERVVTSLVGTESGGNWGARNNATGSSGRKGHYGRLQFGHDRLDEARNALGRSFTVSEFLENPDLQRQVENWHFGQIDNYIQKNGLDQYNGQEINGTVMNPDSMRAIAHLGGSNGLKKYLESGGKYNPADANGTHLSDYARIHASTNSNMPTAPTNPGSNVIETAMVPREPMDKYEVSQGGKLAENPLFNFLFAGSTWHNALQGQEAANREAYMREQAARGLPAEYQDLYRYNPQMAIDLWRSRSGGAGGSIPRDERTAKQKEWDEYEEVKRKEASGELPQGSSDEFRRFLMYERSPDWNREYQQAGAEGKQFPKDIKDAESQMMYYDNKVKNALRVGTLINEIYDISGAAGWPQLFNFVKESDPRRLNQLLKTLKDNIALDKMMELKNLSASGATGFGQLTERELELLQNQLENLDESMPPEKLRTALSDVLETYRGVYESAKRGYTELNSWYNKYRENLAIDRPYTFEENPFNPWEHIKTAKQEHIERTQYPGGEPRPAPITGPMSTPGAVGGPGETAPRRRVYNTVTGTLEDK